MAEGKIEIAVGSVSFKGEGSEAWLSSELDKMLKHLPELVNVAPLEQTEHGEHKKPIKHKDQGTLAAYLSAKKANQSQSRKFLATALWLQDNGNEHLTTNAVTKALDENKQGKLTNASAALADKITRGFCAKGKGREFYVTEEGRTEIG